MLNQALMGKGIASQFAKAAGENGFKLARAAFAVTLKLSENLEVFNQFNEEVGLYMMELDEGMAKS